MVNYFVQEFEKKHQKDLSGDRKASRRLGTSSEVAKRILSSTVETNIEIDSLFEGIDFYFKLTRTKFEELKIDLYRKCVNVVDDCLRDAKIDRRVIDDVVLIGGSQQLLQYFFNGKELCKSINPDEAVAYGAAVQAAVLRRGIEQVQDLLLFDVTPFSLGLKCDNGDFSFYIPKNSIIPIRKERIRTTIVNNQTGFILPVYEGEEKIARENKFLGQFELNGISLGPKGRPRINVCFEIDANGILIVTAEEKRLHIKNKIVISDYRGGLSEVETKRIIKEAEKYKLEDEAYNKKLETKPA